MANRLIEQIEILRGILIASATGRRPSHLGEMGLTGSAVTVAACLSEVGVSSEAFDEVLDVGYLLQLA